MDVLKTIEAEILTSTEVFKLDVLKKECIKKTSFSALARQLNTVHDLTNLRRYAWYLC